MPNRRRQPLTFADVGKLALAWPGVTAATSYGAPAFKVSGRFLTRLHAAEQSLVFKLGSMAERDALLQADPTVFHITEHYRNYPDVLVRLATVGPARLRRLLAAAWQRAAPAGLLRELAAAPPAGKLRKIARRRRTP